MRIDPWWVGPAPASRRRIARRRDRIGLAPYARRRRRAMTTRSPHRSSCQRARLCTPPLSPCCDPDDVAGTWVIEMRAVQGLQTKKCRKFATGWNYSVGQSPKVKTNRVVIFSGQSSGARRGRGHGSEADGSEGSEPRADWSGCLDGDRESGASEFVSPSPKPARELDSTSSHQRTKKQSSPSPD